MRPFIPARDGTLAKPKTGGQVNELHQAPNIYCNIATSMKLYDSNLFKVLDEGTRRTCID